ncbi:MAG: GNAT family N-acetyltransferase [Pyrinomonadaceae bacterium]
MSGIRPFADADLDAVIAVFRSNIPKYFGPEEEQGLRDFLRDTRAEDYHVVEVDGEVVGAGGIALNEDNTVSLCWGMVRNDLIGTGLGKEMTLFRMDRSREKWPGVPIVLNTSQHTEGFYLKLGFRTVEHTPDGHGPGIDSCKMRLDT